MIPENTILSTVEQQEHATLSYRIDFKNKRIQGTVDGLEACVQALLKIILTERYSSVIYTAEYGVELEALIGLNIELVKIDVERRLSEALSADNRFVGISQFSANVISDNELQISFLLETIYGQEVVQQLVLI